MTKFNYSKEDHPSSSQTEGASSNETAQILHLKRLLVTLKQHYEKSLSTAQVQLQDEQSQKVALQKEVENLKDRCTESQKCHEEELFALRDQQMALKDLLKKAQDELKQWHDQPVSSQPDELADRQRVEQLERVLPYLRDRTEEAHLETEQLRDELDHAHKKIKTLEQKLVENKQRAQCENQQLQQLLETQKQQEDPLETVVSQTSSHYLRQELEVIKRTVVEGSQETKALETRYIELLNEKIGLEHQYKQLHIQLEHQSSNLTSFQVQLHEMKDLTKDLEESVQMKEKDLVESEQQRQELQTRIQSLDEGVKEKNYIQDKYEQLKDEWKQLEERLEEAVEIRRQAEQHLNQLEIIATTQENQLQEFSQQLQLLHQEKESVETERNQLKILLEESETRLRVAQQHLAKKVKEVAVLSEKMQEQQTHFTDFSQTVDYQKTQLVQLQTSIELYQRQEKRLQEQLNEALKGTEGQVAKWEEKYFRMYDKWQESENRIRELKKFEEKHHQMQSLLSNLGSFMGGSFNSSPTLYSTGQESTERPTHPFSFDTSLSVENAVLQPESLESENDKYDLFGMKQPPDKYNPPFFS